MKRELKQEEQKAMQDSSVQVTHSMCDFLILGLEIKEQQ